MDHDSDGRGAFGPQHVENLLLSDVGGGLPEHVEIKVHVGRRHVDARGHVPGRHDSKLSLAKACLVGRKPQGRLRVKA